MVTALFCDVVGSTTLAESMDPEEWSEIVNEVVASMAAAVERYDGTMSQFAGDSILALFGAPTAHEDDPYRAVRAGLDIIDAVRAARRDGAGPDVHVRVGISTGLVVVGDVAAGALNIYSALGDMPNVAARLQGMAEPDSLLIAEDTYRLVVNDVDAREVGPVDLKGRTDPVKVYEVSGARSHGDRRRGVSGLRSPMVGRADQLDALHQLLEAAESGAGRVAFITGEPGVGKSRLVEELIADARDRPRALLGVGHCVPYDDELPFHLVTSLVRSLAGTRETDAPEVVRKAIDDLAEVGLGGGPGAADRLLQLLGLHDVRPDESPESLRAAYRETMARLLTGLSIEHGPIVLVCEDAHWADASSAELVSGLLGEAVMGPVLLVVVMRPDRDGPGWSILADARRELAESLTEIHLSPLEQRDSRALVANLLAVESLPADLRQLVLDKAEGNPFFLEEVVRMLIERGLVEYRDGRWTAHAGITALEVPATVQGLLASRIDRLAPDVRRLGRVAAVIGRRFTTGLLEEVHGAPVDAGSGVVSTRALLGQLEAHGLVQLVATRPEPEFEFRHALVHDVMYEGMLRRDRRALHGAVAAAIERTHPERLDELASALARHHAEAGHTASAIDYLLTAGRLAHERGARMEAHRAYTHAVELLDGDADQRLRVEAVLGQVTTGMTFVPVSDTIASLEGVLDAAADVDDPDLLARVYAALISARGMQGESYRQPDYRRQLDAAHALVPRLTDPATTGLLQAMLGWSMRDDDEHRSAIAPLRAAVDLQEEAGRLADASYNSAFLAHSLATLGEFEEAQTAIDRALQLAEASGDRNTIADAAIFAGRVAAERGDLEEALEHTRRGLDGAAATGNTFCSLAGNFFAADQKMRLGQDEDALAHLEQSTELAEFCNAGGYEALSQAWLVTARARLGDVAADDFDGPLSAAVASGSRSSEALVRLNRATVLAATSELERSFEDFERAVALFEEIGARPQLARVHHAYGTALQVAGRADDARTHLEGAARLFEQLGIQPDPAAA